MVDGLEQQEARPRGSLDFTESSVLDTVVPLHSDIDIEDALKGSVERSGDSSISPLASIPQRQAVFFDETVNVYIVLQTPYFDERSLRSYLGRLAINLEAQVVNSPGETQEGPPGHELIYNGSIQDSEDPLVLIQGPDHSDTSTSEGHILVVWRVSAFLARPRLRLQNPSVVFSANANLKPSKDVQNDTLRAEYLPSQVPSAINMLEAFSGDPAMGGINPRLSALRVSRVTPAAQALMDVVLPLKNISRQSIKIYPCLNSRVKYSRPSSAPANLAVIALVDIEITPFAGCEITLKSVQLNITGARVEDLNSSCGLSLPIKALPQDDVTLLYKLEPDEYDTMNKSPVKDLEISITATAHLSEVCQPQISMRWVTSLSFTPPVNPGFGHPTPPIQRPHRPAQLSIGSAAEVSTAHSLAASRPDALPTMDITTRHQRNTSIPDFGVTMTFTGPPHDHPIHPGVAFAWSVFIVNRSDRARKLALMVVPKRRRSDTRITRQPSIGHTSRRHDPKVAEAVVDENIVHAMQRNSSIESTEIVCLSTDTRVGPLAPGACYDVELRFMPLKVGIVTVEAVRVVDLGTQEHLDITSALPTCVVTEEESVVRALG